MIDPRDIPSGEPRWALALVLLLLLWGSPSVFAQNQPDFFGLGDLPGGAVASGANAISADGAVVVGDSESGSGTEAFRWTSGGGMTGLGTLSGGDFFSTANGVSSNGSVVAGTASNSDGGTAFRWTSGGGMTGLDQLGCSPLCPDPALGAGISPDGQTVVGAGLHKTLFGDPHGDGVRWAGGGTSDSRLATPGTGSHAEAAQGNDANTAGTILVGESSAGGPIQAVVWTSSGSTASVLPAPAGAVLNSTALAISADGSTIVGGTNTSPSMSTSIEAAMWTGGGYGTLTLLGDLGASSPRSRAWDVTSDGGIVVGTARNAEGDDRAFIWDAVHGMQDLAAVLLDDYGVDVGGWQLLEARGVSDPNGQGEFAVVGRGINPSGDDEAWYAFLSPVACNDGVDNDSDTDTDFPADSGCNRKSDRSETADCGDGLDNDGDGQTDTADGGCNDAADPTEEPDCGDGIDNDGDGLVDFPADPGCRSATQAIENPACNDGIDNEPDGQTDFPADPGCLAADDFSEGRDCNDGIDNDGDGLVDYPADPDCTGINDPAEDPQCNDRVDNDGDLATDYPAAYPACTSALDTVEAPACSDGTDNDSDAATDHPADVDCLAEDFLSEAPVYLATGSLLALDEGSGTFFRLDTGTGTQTVLSQSASLTAPQGLAQRATGEWLVADPSGLYDVVPVVGTQQSLAGPLTAGDSLQLVVDAAGDVLVLEKEEISGIDGTGTKTTRVAMPVDAILAVFRGDSLVQESDGRLLVTAFGFLGEGIFRIDPSQNPVTYEMVSPQLSTDQFEDLALEANGTILAVGTRISTGETGVFRVVPSGGSMGSTTTLSNDPAWTAPVAVAVAGNGDIFVLDEGTCTAGSCTGAEIVRVDPVSGARLNVFSGGAITGPGDLAFVASLPECQDGDDDDGDSFVDFAADPDCRHPWDPSEAPDCSDGLDNDGDGLVDFPADPGCTDAMSQVENPECNDGLDNDGDGLVDFGSDPNCLTADDDRELQKTGCGLTGAEALLLLCLLRRRGRLASGIRRRAGSLPA